MTNSLLIIKMSNQRLENEKKLLMQINKVAIATLESLEPATLMPLKNLEEAFEYTFTKGDISLQLIYTKDMPKLKEMIEKSENTIPELEIVEIKIPKIDGIYRIDLSNCSKIEENNFKEFFKNELGIKTKKII